MCKSLSKTLRTLLPSREAFRDNIVVRSMTAHLGCVCTFPTDYCITVLWCNIVPIVDYPFIDKLASDWRWSSVSISYNEPPMVKINVVVAILCGIITCVCFSRKSVVVYMMVHIHACMTFRTRQFTLLEASYLQTLWKKSRP